ncbi:MAG: polyribonucleotide nucleotidyltransferase [Lachnospiraceae bacterium]|nr:polyribonucleotide nucleotidyltransferase [Lachnospiraceae bacterium]
MSHIFEMELAGRKLKAEIGKVAEQASGAVILSYGETTILSSATASKKPREGVDFFPLSVDYEEKMYSIGKIPGGFLKREGRPSENATLTARCIDRPMRPLFPKDYRNDVSIVNTVLTVDQDCAPETLAMLGSSIAVSVSDIPFYGPVGAVNVGMVDGELIINPTSEQRKVSDLDLTVASTAEKVVMIEAGANEVPEDKMIEAIFLAHETNQQIVAWINEIVAVCGKPKSAYEEQVVPECVFEALKKVCPPEQMEEAVFTDDKMVRDERVAKVTADFEAYIAALPEEEQAKLAPYVAEGVYQYQKKTVRKMIKVDGKRPDGRAMTEIRPLSAEIDLLPRVHGSALFKRGQTQVLNIVTLGAMSERQILDSLDVNVETKRYMHQYNMPSYSVGETKPSRGPGRREIGHGALAERALVPVLPTPEEFPYAIRSVSEVLSSNGSTSQGSICASSMALMAAGVPLKAPVAGISCGLVTGDTDDDFVLLTDIQGLEDFFGDMDFKVAGTHKGITAIQMDIKVKGLTRAVIEGAIARTKEARTYILDEVMAKAISAPAEHLSAYAPKIFSTKISVNKIGEVVGPKGKMINKIIDETGTQIDIEEDGSVYVLGLDEEMCMKAIKTIETIAKEIQMEEIYNAKVVRLANFGAFVELLPGKDALLHLSEISYDYVNKVEDVLELGDELMVKVIGIDDQGKVKVSRKALLPPPEGVDLSAPRQNNFRRERNDRNDHRGYRRDNR